MQDRNKIKQFIQRLPGADTAAIREALNDNAPGIDTKIKITCQSCQNEMEVDLPITESFFRPKKQRGTGE